MKLNKSNKSSFFPTETTGKSKIPFVLILSFYVPLSLGLLIIALQKAHPIPKLTQDPLSISRLPFYYGIISNLGILFWCTAAAICFFTAFILNQTQTSEKFSKFLVFSGLFTTLLLVDDLLMVHEQVFPRFLGIPEKLCFLMYGVLAVWYLLSFRRTILNTNWLLFALSLSWLAFSILLDSASIFKRVLGEDFQYLFEDGAKLLGIATWMMYYSYTCWQVLKQHILLKNAIAAEKIPVPLD